MAQHVAMNNNMDRSLIYQNSIKLNNEYVLQSNYINLHFHIHKMDYIMFQDLSYLLVYDIKIQYKKIVYIYQITIIYIQQNNIGDQELLIFVADRIIHLKKYNFVQKSSRRISRFVKLEGIKTLLLMIKLKLLFQYLNSLKIQIKLSKSLNKQNCQQIKLIQVQTESQIFFAMVAFNFGLACNSLIVSECIFFQLSTVS
ncbi:unnamed protein product [Paramecium sonneborni]|uniref:Uncharacterized protein n=1 Tax=Paramecium sonneborni TaxID=65129 RepID=A0A8S1QVN6_9CILI|nr:unnamed protein product [Paramecium sonneborni]